MQRDAAERQLAPIFGDRWLAWLLILNTALYEPQAAGWAKSSKQMLAPDVVEAPVCWEGADNPTTAISSGQWAPGMAWVAVIHDIHDNCAVINAVPGQSVSNAALVCPDFRRLERHIYQAPGCPLRVLAVVAMHPQMVPEDKMKWAECRDWDRRAAVAADPQIPPHLLRGLLYDPNPNVQVCALANPQLDPSQVRSHWNRLRATPVADGSSLAINVLRHPGCPSDIVLHYFTSDNEGMKQLALRHPGLPEEYRQLYRLSV